MTGLNGFINKIFLLLSGFLLTLNLVGQTFFGPGGAIPDDGNPVSFTINVAQLSHSSIDTAFGLESVCFNIMHTWDSDLEIALIAPDGSFVELLSGLGGGDDNFLNTCLTNNIDSSVLFAVAPFTGIFHPAGDPGIVNNGQPGTGAWKLYIHDTWAYADQGHLIDWSITFGENPSKPFPFESSNLPIIVINTYKKFIPDDPKIMAHMGIIDNGPGMRNYRTDPFNGYDGFIGIERRGSSSQSFPKKSFGFETWDQLGSEIKRPVW